MTVRRLGTKRNWQSTLTFSGRQPCALAITMHINILLTTMVTFLFGQAACRPAEKVETPQPSPLDTVIEIKDGLGFNFIQKRLISALNPKPIVDTLTEDEKYGNKVEHVFGIRIVKGVERVSNAVNSVFTVPDEATKSASHRLTDFLDTIGGRLVGLQK